MKGRIVSFQKKKEKYLYVQFVNLLFSVFSLIHIWSDRNNFFALFAFTAGLTFCNVSIFYQVGKLTRMSRNNLNSMNRYKHLKTETILAGIVIMFCICHSLRIFLAFYYVSILDEENPCDLQPTRMSIMSALNHLLLMVNSSATFIINCAVGAKFRKALKDMFCYPVWLRDFWCLKSTEREMLS